MYIYLYMVFQKIFQYTNINRFINFKFSKIGTIFCWTLFIVDIFEILEIMSPFNVFSIIFKKFLQKTSFLTSKLVEFSLYISCIFRIFTLYITLYIVHDQFCNIYIYSVFLYIFLKLESYTYMCSL